MAKKVERVPRNASFTTNGKNAHIKPDRDGLKVNAALTATNIVSAGTGETQNARVGVTRKEAAFTTEDAQKLGINVRLFTKPITTLMGGSSRTGSTTCTCSPTCWTARSSSPGRRSTSTRSSASARPRAASWSASRSRTASSSPPSAAASARS